MGPRISSRYPFPLLEHDDAPHDDDSAAPNDDMDAE